MNKTFCPMKTMGDIFDVQPGNGVLFVDASREYAYLASPEEIAENDFNLNIPRYVDTFEEEEEIDLMAVRAEREKLKMELARLEDEMEGYLKELGYGA